MNFSPFPELTTERLILRQLKDTDDQSIFFLRSDEELNRFLDRPKQSNVGEARKFILKINGGIRKNEWIYWAICLKGNADPIGTVCIWNFSEDKTVAEIGYELMPVFQGMGFMSETIQCVADYGFGTLGLGNLEAYTHAENIRSIRLLQKNHFILEVDRKDEGNIHQIIYSLTRPSHKVQWMEN